MATGQYDDAWETPGWTAQNMAYPPEVVVNPYPLDVDVVTLTGHFGDGGGRGANGWLYIDNGNTVLRHLSAKQWVNPIKKRVEIRGGTFSVTVPATDSAALVGYSPWSYHIRISLEGRPFKEGFNISLPKANPLVDVFDLTFNAASSGLTVNGSDSGGFALGGQPDELTVHLTTGADFNSTLTNADGWGDAVVTLVLGNSGTTWTATVSGTEATFAVDKAQADAMPAGTKAKLVVTSGQNDEVWAIGKVVRHA